MLKNLENKGNPWGMGECRRLEWAEELDFEVPVVDGTIGAEVEYLFWVGCAGALEDRAKKTTKAIATLLHQAGVNFAILGPAETCTGDPARRMGNEFVYSMLAQQNIETLNEAAWARPGRRSSPAARTASTRSRTSTRSSAGNYEVVHHTQLLARLVEQGKIKPGRRHRGEDHLPRPVLPGPAQQGVHPAAGDHGDRARGPDPGNAPVQEPWLLLRRGRGPDVDGRADRQADQHRADRRGPRHRPRHHLHRLPLLPGHARRRRRGQEGQRRSQGKPRGGGRRPGPGPVHAAARAARGRRPPAAPAAPAPADQPTG